MRKVMMIVSAVALIATPTLASAAGGALPPTASERAQADVKDANGMAGKNWLLALGVASMAILAVLVSKSHSPESP